MTLLNQIRRESASRLGMALAALLLFSIFGHAQPLHHWTWEGRTGTEGHPRPDGDWWEDKLGNVPMSFVSDGTVERVALPATGPGSAFPDPMPQTGGHNIFGVDTRIDGGYIRTGPTPAFNRDRFTVEVFFNPVTVAGTSERRFFDMSHSVQMGRGLVRNGVLAARIYTPDGGAANSVLQSNLSVVAGKDYYAAIGVSTGPNAADRFVDFYLKNLTDNGPLQYQRVSLDSRFTGTNHRVGGHSLRIGRDNAFHVIGDVRYSNGILAEADLLVSQPPMPPLVLEALGVDTESGGVTLGFRGMPNRPYQLEVSEDLASWRLGNQLRTDSDALGLAVFYDAAAAGLDRRFYRMRPVRASVTVTPYFLSSDVLDVRVYPYDRDIRDQADRFLIEVRQNGSLLESKETAASVLSERIVVPSDQVGEGDYEVVVHFLDTAGNPIERIVSHQRRPIPTWVSEPPGITSFVPAPFEPVEVNTLEVHVWDRTYAFAPDAFLPAQMTAAQQPLFASAPRLKAAVDGQPAELTGTLALAANDPEHAVYEFSGFLGPVAVEATTRIEFDGFILIDFALEAAGRTIDSLMVEFPVLNQHAELYTLHAYYDERNHRNDLPVDPVLTGGIPRAGLIDNGFTIGFNHAVWLGTPRRGFQWVAETAKHWAIVDRSRSIEVLPDDEPGVTMFRLRVIDKPVQPSRLEYQWGLMAGPVRPYGRQGQDFYFGQNAGSFLTAETLADRIAQENHFVDYYLDIAGDELWYHVFANWNADFAFGQPFREIGGMDMRRDFNDWLQSKGTRPVWYGSFNGMHRNMEMYPYYGEAMRRVPFRFDFDGDTECAYGGFIEYLAGGAAWMIENLGMEGIYLDHVSGAEPCFEELHGCGFVDPDTGKRVVSRDFFGRREAFKRVYKIFNGEILPEGLIYSHDGWAPILGIMSFTHINHTAEEALFEYFDNLDFYRAKYNPTQLGVPVEHAWRPDHPVERNHAWGVSLIHGNRIKMYPHRLTPGSRGTSYAPEAGIDWRMWASSRWFNWESPWSWHPYYENGNVLQVSAENVVASFHVNDDGQIAFTAFNSGEQEEWAFFTLQNQQLGLPSTLHARDVVTGDTFQFSGGSFGLSVLGKRPRVLVIAPQPIGANDL